jgi:hypothetical protein
MEEPHDMGGCAGGGGGATGDARRMCIHRWSATCCVRFVFPQLNHHPRTRCRDGDHALQRLHRIDRVIKRVDTVHEVKFVASESLVKLLSRHLEHRCWRIVSERLPNLLIVGRKRICEKERDRVSRPAAVSNV